MWTVMTGTTLRGEHGHRYVDQAVCSSSEHRARAPTIGEVALIYDRTFFENLTDNEPSAAVLMPLILALVKPKTLVDVGGGTGVWSAIAGGLGVDATVVDSQHVATDQLVVPPERFVVRDLAASLELADTFDLALCLEVAEHLPPDRGPSFVGDLCRLAPTVVFSAAIPGQRGDGHINERWQSYWVGLFAGRGYEALDLIRPGVWHDERIALWYRQNTFVATRTPEAFELGNRPLWDVAHPVYWENWNLALEKPHVRPLLRKLPGAVGRELKRRLAR
jgi:hypothetical protein